MPPRIPPDVEAPIYEVSSISSYSTKWPISLLKWFTSAVCLLEVVQREVLVALISSTGGDIIGLPCRVRSRKLEACYSIWLSIGLSGVQASYACSHGSKLNIHRLTFATWLFKYSFFCYQCLSVSNLSSSVGPTPTSRINSVNRTIIWDT